jgi:hypothetical protein
MRATKNGFGRQAASMRRFDALRRWRLASAIMFGQYRKL